MAAIMAAIMEITENIMRRMHEPSTKLHNALYFMSGMMVVILALVIVAGVKTKAENAGFHLLFDSLDQTSACHALGNNKNRTITVFCDHCCVDCSSDRRTIQQYIIKMFFCKIK